MVDALEICRTVNPALTDGYLEAVGHAFDVRRLVSKGKTVPVLLPQFGYPPPSAHGAFESGVESIFAAHSIL